MIIVKRLILVCCLLISGPMYAEEIIESFHSDIEINHNGDLLVTETIVVNAEGREIKRGIYRDFPTRYKNSQGGDHIVGFELLSIKRNGVAEPHFSKTISNGTRIYIGDNNVYLSHGVYQYEIRYRTTRQLGFFDEYDELYWNVTGNGWSFPINSASALVNLPGQVGDFQLSGYTGIAGSTAQELNYHRVANNQVYFETTSSLNPKEGLTIVAAWNKGVVAEPSAAQRRGWFINDNLPALMIAIGSFILLLYYWLIWVRVGRDPQAGVIIPRYQPPEGYSPASMRYIQNMGYDKKCFSSALINLAVKGVVEIDDDDGSFKVIKTDNTGASLAPGEATIIKHLFRPGSDQISIMQSNHRILGSTLGKHESSLKVDYQKRYFNTNRRYLIPAILLSLATIVLTVLQLGSEEVIVRTLLPTFGSLILVYIAFNSLRGLFERGKLGWVRFFSSAAVLIIVAVFASNTKLPVGMLLDAMNWPITAGVLLIIVMNAVFYKLLQAPTLAGRKLLDQIEGFKHYLEVAEDDEIAARDAPEFSSDLYERYLPYAIALDLENEWTARLNRAVEKGSISQSYDRPRWYRSQHHDRHFSKTLSTAFSSAIASSSQAPGSSSGSSGGSSGGGGGGGGGGGW